MNWKQPIPTNLEELTKGDKFAATIFEKLLLRAANKPHMVYIGDTEISLERGQSVCGRYELAKCFGMKQSEAGRVQRKVKKLASPLKLINKQKSRDCSVITILNYDELTRFEPSDEQSVDNQQTNHRPSVNTNKSVKNGKNVNISSKEGGEIYGTNTQRI